MCEHTTAHLLKCVSCGCNQPKASISPNTTTQVEYYMGCYLNLHLLLQEILELILIYTHLSGPFLKSDHYREGQLRVIFIMSLMLPGVLLKALALEVII